jgi:ammonium transporter, Amt family
MGIAVVYSFVVSFIIFKFINFIVPMRVSNKEEEEGLDASQHNEKYVQGTILVATKEGVVEKEVRADFFETIAATTEKTNGTATTVYSK